VCNLGLYSSRFFYVVLENNAKALLTDIGTEELAHVEVISTMVYQLVKDATPEEMKAAGLGAHYAQHANALYPSDANGIPWTAAYIQSTADPVTDLHEDMAAEQKALATYYRLISMTDDVDVKEILKFLAEREVVHYQRFGEALMDVYDFGNSKKVF